MNTITILAACALASLTNNPKPAATPTNRALAFDGVDDFVSVPAAESMMYPGRGGWTVELWVKPVVYPFKQEVSVIGQESVGTDARDPWSIRAHPTHFEFRIDDEHGDSERLRFDLALGVWQHLVCVYGCEGDGEQARRSLSVFIDGELVECRETGIVMEPRLDPVYMGALGSARFTGLIDEVRVWSVALNRAAAQLAMQGAVSADSPELRAWWSFDEHNGGPVAIDRSQTGTHAVLGRPNDPNDQAAPARVTRKR